MAIDAASIVARATVARRIAARGRVHAGEGWPLPLCSPLALAHCTASCGLAPVACRSRCAVPARPVAGPCWR
jgi:hypothetical protein